MNIQTLHPAPAQIAPEQRPAPAVEENARNAVTGADEAPGITAAQQPAGSAGENGIQGELRDRYAPEERVEGTGRYAVEKDEEGSTVIRFDDPEKAAREKEAAEAARKEAEEAEEKKERRQEEETTINTDRVDREIERLKEEVEDLEQALHYGGSLVDAEKVEEDLTFARFELRLKDNDTYRRANALVTEGE